jgi:hypothetical protein
MRRYAWHAFHWGEKPADPLWVDARIAHWRHWCLPQLQAMAPRFDAILVYVRSRDRYALAQWRQQPVTVVEYDRDLLASDALLAADRGQDWIAWTRLDSDDLLGRSYLRHLAAIAPADGLAAVCEAPGLCYEPASRSWGRWPHPFAATSTIFIPGARWQDRAAAHAYAYCRHGEVRQRFRHAMLPTLAYCVMIHGANDTSTMRHRLQPTGPLARHLAAEYPSLWEHTHVA